MSSAHGSANSPSSMAGRCRPEAWLHFVHSGENQAMSVRGKNLGSSRWRSAVEWSVLGWFALWMPTAMA